MIHLDNPEEYAKVLNEFLGRYDDLISEMYTGERWEKAMIGIALLHELVGILERDA